jgi:hypothetical protein
VETTFTTPCLEAAGDINRRRNLPLHTPDGPRRQRTRRLESWPTFQWPMREPHHPAQHQPSARSSTSPQKPARTLLASIRRLPQAHASVRSRSNLHTLPYNLEPCLRLARLLLKAHQHSPRARLSNRTLRRRERSRSPAWPTYRVLPLMKPAHSLRRARCRGGNGAIQQMSGPSTRSARCLSQISSRWLQAC